MVFKTNLVKKIKHSAQGAPGPAAKAMSHTR